MSKHTPGPFKVVECDGSFEIRTMDDKCLADAWSYGINSNAEEMEANANLFAAAPDLLDSLIALTEDAFPRFTGGCVGTFDIRQGAYESALTAIARVKGESS